MTASIREKIFMAIFAGILVLLFLMSSTDLIIKEKKREIYRVSVIVEDSGDEYYVNLKKGMDQASLEHNIDVNFITLYERNSSEQQKELMEREIEVGTQAIILAPVDPEKALAMLDNMTVDIPVVILGNEEPAGNKVMANISMDYFASGRMLIEEILRRTPEDSSIYLFTEGLQYGSNRRLYDGIESALSERGMEAVLIEKAFKNRYTDVMAERVKKEENALIIALDTESLIEVAGIKELNEAEFGTIPLYGQGATLKILHNMELGRIDGVLAQNLYNAGYLCMEKAVEAIDSKMIKETVTLDGYFLTKSDITKKEYEKMLYPIR